MRCFLNSFVYVCFYHNKSFLYCFIVVFFSKITFCEARFSKPVLFCPRELIVFNCPLSIVNYSNESQQDETKLRQVRGKSAKETCPKSSIITSSVDMIPVRQPILVTQHGLLSENQNMYFYQHFINFSPELIFLKCLPFRKTLRYYHQDKNKN